MSEQKPQAKPVAFPVVEAPPPKQAPWLDTPPANERPIRNLFEPEPPAAPAVRIPSAASYPPPPPSEPDAPPRRPTQAPPAQPQPRAAAPQQQPQPPRAAAPQQQDDGYQDEQPDERVLSQLPPPPRLGSLIPGARSAPPPATGQDYGAALSSEQAEAFANAAIELAVARDAALSGLEGQLLDLAIEIAAALIERQVEREPELHATLARAALASLGDAERVTLRTSPLAYEAICQSLGGPEANVRGVRVQVAADDTIPGLGCVVDGDSVRVDATVSERLRAVRRAFEDERRKTVENQE